MMNEIINTVRRAAIRSSLGLCLLMMVFLVGCGAREVDVPDADGGAVVDMDVHYDAEDDDVYMDGHDLTDYSPIEYASNRDGNMGTQVEDGNAGDSQEKNLYNENNHNIEDYVMEPNNEIAANSENADRPVYDFGRDFSGVSQLSVYITPLPIYMFPSFPCLTQWSWSSLKRVIKFANSRVTTFHAYHENPVLNQNSIESDFSRIMQMNGFVRISYMNAGLDFVSEPTDKCVVYTKNNLYASIEHVSYVEYLNPFESAFIHRVAYTGDVTITESPFGHEDFSIFDFFIHEVFRYIMWFPSDSAFGQLFPMPSKIIVEYNRFDGVLAPSSELRTFVIDIDESTFHQWHDLIDEFGRQMMRVSQFREMDVFSGIHRGEFYEYHLSPFTKVYDNRIERALDRSNNNIDTFYQLIYRTVYRINASTGSNIISVDIITTQNQGFQILFRDIWDAPGFKGL